jgi:hypothetical protein
VTVLSSRFAGPAIGLLLLSAAPVWFHAVAAPTRDACADAAAFFGAPEIGGAPRVPWDSIPGGAEGVEVRLASGGRRLLSGRVLRTFDPSGLYGTPMDLGFHRMLYLQPMEIRALDAGGETLPVRFASDTSQGYARVEAYLYTQGGMAVRHPVLSGLALGPGQLTGGTLPLYVFIVSGSGRREELPQLERAAERWLVDAWRELQTACGAR